MNSAIPRGKHKKLKKMKEKYAEQDEEEREMLLQMLGSRKVKGMDYSGAAAKENISNNEPMEVEE